MKKEPPRIPSYITAISTGLITVAFLAVFSCYTSPLFPSYFGYDQGFFMLTGKMVASGKIPYIDFFDMKGPLIFFINAAGQILFAGREGCLFIQIPFFFTFLFFMQKIVLIFIKDRRRHIITAVTLILLPIFFGRGNLTEEYSLPFLMICTYFACRFLHDGRFSPLYGFIFGLSASFIAFLRINNAALIFGEALYICFYFIIQKQWKNLIATTVSFLCGAFAVCCPIFVYFACKSAIPEMLYGTFGLPSRYAVAGTDIRTFIDWINILIKCAPAILSFLISIYVCLCSKKHREHAQMTAIASVTVVFSLLLGFDYPHYYVLAIPPFAVSLTILFSATETIDLKLPFMKTAAVCLILISALFPYKYLSHMINEYSTVFERYSTRSYLTDVNEFIEQSSLIPETERDSVLAYSVPSSWYYITGTDPCYKYCAFQDIFINLDDRIKHELNDYFSQTPPLWIVRPSVSAGQINGMDKYTLISETSNMKLQLYRLSGQ